MSVQVRPSAEFLFKSNRVFGAVSLKKASFARLIKKHSLFKRIPEEVVQRQSGPD
jgi:hypothetical protein